MDLPGAAEGRVTLRGASGSVNTVRSSYVGVPSPESKRTAARAAVRHSVRSGSRSDRAADLAEDRADLTTQEDECDDRDDRDEGEDQRVLGETLPVLVPTKRGEEPV